MYIRHDILRILNSIVLSFSLMAAVGVGLLIMRFGAHIYIGIAVFIISFVGIYLGSAKLFDKIFKITK
jgi:hypothetical protein